MGKSMESMVSGEDFPQQNQSVDSEVFTILHRSMVDHYQWEWFGWRFPTSWFTIENPRDGQLFLPSMEW